MKLGGFFNILHDIAILLALIALTMSFLYLYTGEEEA